MSFIGALKKLQELKLLDTNTIENIITVSAGSIIGLLLTLDFTYSEMVNETCKANFEKFKDVKYANFLYGYGLDSGEGLKKWTEYLMELKGFKKDTTFSELFIKTGKNLQVVTTNLNKYKLHVFDHISSPKMKVSLAIRMSIGIPFLFSAIVYNDETFVDAALIDNFPMYLVKDKNNSFGIKANFDEISESNEKEQIKGLEQYAFHIFKCFWVNSKKNLDKKMENVLEINSIENENIDIVNFNININNRLKLIKHGYLQATNRFLQKSGTKKSKSV